MVRPAPSCALALLAAVALSNSAWPGQAQGGGPSALRTMMTNRVSSGVVYATTTEPRRRAVPSPPLDSAPPGFVPSGSAVWGRAAAGAQSPDSPRDTYLSRQRAPWRHRSVRASVGGESATIPRGPLCPASRSPVACTPTWIRAAVQQCAPGALQPRAVPATRAERFRRI